MPSSTVPAPMWRGLTRHVRSPRATTPQVRAGPPDHAARRIAWAHHRAPWSRSVLARYANAASRAQSRIASGKNVTAIPVPIASVFDQRRSGLSPEEPLDRLDRSSFAPGDRRAPAPPRQASRGHGARLRTRVRILPCPVKSQSQRWFRSPLHPRPDRATRDLRSAARFNECRNKRRFPEPRGFARQTRRNDTHGGEC